MEWLLNFLSGFHIKGVSLLGWLQQFQRISFLAQFFVVGLVVLMSRHFSLLSNRKMIKIRGATPFVYTCIDAFCRISFPVYALLMTIVAQSLLTNYHFSIKIFHVVVPLLLALAAIRLSLYIIRQTFARDSHLLKTTERFITVTVWVTFALHLLGVLDTIFIMLNDIGFRVGRSYISILFVLDAIVIIGMVTIVMFWLMRLAEERLMRAEQLEVNLRIVLSKVLRAVFILLSLLLSLPLAGIDITALSVFGGALGVGLGFGLQKIASNYVSGFIILLEKSIKLGDLLKVGESYGQVSQLNTRYIVIKDLSGIEFIIPNETLIGTTVINYSHTNSKMRVAIPVVVGYQSDIAFVKALILEITTSHARVLSDPAPNVFVKNFADSGIELEIGLWISDPELGVLAVRSYILENLLTAFAEHHIEIPYPYRQLVFSSEMTQSDGQTEALLGQKNTITTTKTNV